MSFEPSVMPIRASAFGGLFDCALRFQKEQLEGYRKPNSPRALLGTGVHAGTAAFDAARLDQSPIRIDDAVGVALDAIADRIDQEGVAWSSDEPGRPEIERTTVHLTSNYCSVISPQYQFESVELTTKPLDIDCGNNTIIRLTGTLDRCRVRKLADGVRRGISDVKTGKSAVGQDGRASTKKHRPQLGTYELLYEHTTGNTITEPAEIIGLNTSGKFAVGTGETKGCKDMLLGNEGMPGLIDLAANMFQTGLFPPNPQSFLCSAKYCSFHSECPYAGE